MIIDDVQHLAAFAETIVIDIARALQITNLKAFCEKLEARGVKFDLPFRSVPAVGLDIAYMTDPSGVYIELTEGYSKY